MTFEQWYQKWYRTQLKRNDGLLNLKQIAKAAWDAAKENK